MVISAFRVRYKNHEGLKKSRMVYGEAQIAGVWGTTQGQDPNWGDPKNVIDRQLSTRWSCRGAGSHVVLDVGGLFILHHVDIAWYHGNERKNNFKIEVSPDKISWTPVFEGQSSGTTLDAERYDIDNAPAQYIRVTGLGAVYPDGGMTDWISITEIFIFADHEAIPAPDLSKVKSGPIDTEDPIVTITSHTDGEKVKPGALTVRGTATDSGGSGIAEVTVNVDNAGFAVNAEDGVWSITAKILDFEGMHKIEVFANDNAGNQGRASISVVVSTTDIFGIKKLYPDADPENSWLINMVDPTSDPRFRNWRGARLTKLADGSWQVDGGDARGQVRLEAWSPLDRKFLDVEITVYSKITAGNELIQLYSRGGHHSTRTPCEGSAYKGRYYGNRSAVVKEVNHPAYCGNRGETRTLPEGYNIQRWQGYKTVIKNVFIDPKFCVTIENYVDVNCDDAAGNLIPKNNWQKVTEYTDTGDWPTNDADFESDCPPCQIGNTGRRQRNEILSLPGGRARENLAAYRTDGTTSRIKYFSVRAIVDA